MINCGYRYCRVGCAGLVGWLVRYHRAILGGGREGGGGALPYSTRGSWSGMVGVDVGSLGLPFLV